MQALPLMDFLIAPKKNYALLHEHANGILDIIRCRVLCAANSISRLFLSLSMYNNFFFLYFLFTIRCAINAHLVVCRYLHLYVQINRVHLK